ncbi:MAG: hypothetical protein CSYNP_01175 [Syntrophus sp. SKADARSKE-3]|nr:hypothetical protein [Syntrophus sp. SKADARSKE-3]
MKKYFCLRYAMVYTALALLVLISHSYIGGLCPAYATDPIDEAAMKMVKFCMDPKSGLDERVVATLVDYVLEGKSQKEHALSKSMDCTGAYYEFDTKITFPRFMKYSYDPVIPSAITRPSSLRYSIWTAPGGDTQKLPSYWKPVHPGSHPVVIRGMQHDSNTPDLTTGVYFEYDLKRTLILLNHKGRQVLVSISKQTGPSNVGKKGVILGNDNDWNYYYSSEPGSAKAGLGWVKSYIYDYFSVGVYAETGSTPTMVRTGVFQWMNAGWSGMNFVKTNHIVAGMKRFARNSRLILESPRLPAPNQMISVYQTYSRMPAGELQRKYATLQQALRASAIQQGKISNSLTEERISNTPKEQMIEELMLEYLKGTLGKLTFLGRQAMVGSSSGKM